MLHSWIGTVRAAGAPGERASGVSTRRATGAAAWCLAALTLAACGGDDATTTGEASMTGPVYALASTVFSATGDRSVYFTTTNSLDVPELSLDGAREYGGVANYAAVNGRLLISSGEAPTITAYDVDDAMSWHER